MKHVFLKTILVIYLSLNLIFSSFYPILTLAREECNPDDPSSSCYDPPPPPPPPPPPNTPCDPDNPYSSCYVPPPPPPPPPPSIPCDSHNPFSSCYVPPAPPPPPPGISTICDPDNPYSSCYQPSAPPKTTGGPKVLPSIIPPAGTKSPAYPQETGSVTPPKPSSLICKNEPDLQGCPGYTNPPISVKCEAKVLKVHADTDCETNLGKKVWLDQWMESDCSLKNHPSDLTSQKCGNVPFKEQPQRISECASKRCDPSINRLVCIEDWFLPDIREHYTKEGHATDYKCIDQKFQQRLDKKLSDREPVVQPVLPPVPSHCAYEPTAQGCPGVPKIISAPVLPPQNLPPPPLTKIDICRDNPTDPICVKPAPAQTTVQPVIPPTITPAQSATNDICRDNPTDPICSKPKTDDYVFPAPNTERQSLATKKDSADLLKAKWSSLFPGQPVDQNIIDQVVSELDSQNIKSDNIDAITKAIDNKITERNKNTGLGIVQGIGNIIIDPGCVITFKWVADLVTGGNCTPQKAADQTVGFFKAIVSPITNLNNQIGSSTQVESDINGDSSINQPGLLDKAGIFDRYPEYGSKWQERLKACHDQQTGLNEVAGDCSSNVGGSFVPVSVIEEDIKNHPDLGDPIKMAARDELLIKAKQLEGINSGLVEQVDITGAVHTVRSNQELAQDKDEIDKLRQQAGITGQDGRIQTSLVDRLPFETRSVDTYYYRQTDERKKVLEDSTGARERLAELIEDLRKNPTIPDPEKEKARKELVQKEAQYYSKEFGVRIETVMTVINVALTVGEPGLKLLEGIGAHTVEVGAVDAARAAVNAAKTETDTLVAKASLAQAEEEAARVAAEEAATESEARLLKKRYEAAKKETIAAEEAAADAVAKVTAKPSLAAQVGRRVSDAADKIGSSLGLVESAEEKVSQQEFQVAERAAAAAESKVVETQRIAQQLASEPESGLSFHAAEQRAYEVAKQEVVQAQEKLAAARARVVEAANNRGPLAGVVQTVDSAKQAVADAKQAANDWWDRVRGKKETPEVAVAPEPVTVSQPAVKPAKETTVTTDKSTTSNVTATGDTTTGNAGVRTKPVEGAPPAESVTVGSETPSRPGGVNESVTTEPGQVGQTTSKTTVTTDTPTTSKVTTTGEAPEVKVTKDVNLHIVDQNGQPLIDYSDLAMNSIRNGDIAIESVKPGQVATISKYVTDIDTLGGHITVNEAADLMRAGKFDFNKTEGWFGTRMPGGKVTIEGGNHRAAAAVLTDNSFKMEVYDSFPDLMSIKPGNKQLIKSRIEKGLIDGEIIAPEEFASKGIKLDPKTYPDGVVRLRNPENFDVSQAFIDDTKVKKLTVKGEESRSVTELAPIDQTAPAVDVHPAVDTKPAPQVAPTENKGRIDTSGLSEENRNNPSIQKSIQDTSPVLKQTFPDKGFGVLSAEGSSAIVYYDLDNPNILFKVAKDESEKTFKYFQKEAEALKILSDKGLAPKYFGFYGKEGEIPIISMERIYFDGGADGLESGMQNMTAAQIRAEKARVTKILQEAHLLPGDVQFVLDKTSGSVKVIDTGGFIKVGDDQLGRIADEVEFTFNYETIDKVVEQVSVVSDPVYTKVAATKSLRDLGYSNEEIDKAFSNWFNQVNHQLDQVFSSKSGRYLVDIGEKAANGASESELRRVSQSLIDKGVIKEADFNQAVRLGQKAKTDLGITTKPQGKIITAVISDTTNQAASAVGQAVGRVVEGVVGSVKNIGKGVEKLVADIGDKVSSVFKGKEVPKPPTNTNPEIIGKFLDTNPGIAGKSLPKSAGAVRSRMDKLGNVLATQAKDNPEANRFWRSLVRDNEGRWSNIKDPKHNYLKLTESIDPQTRKNRGYFKFGHQPVIDYIDPGFIKAGLNGKKLFVDGLAASKGPIEGSLSDFEAWIKKLHTEAGYKLKAEERGVFSQRTGASSGGHTPIIRGSIYDLADKYGDPYRFMRREASGEEFILKLPGIESEGLPRDYIYNGRPVHQYPGSSYYDQYFQMAQQKLGEFKQAFERGDQEAAMRAISDYYQYGINARAFEQVNQSLFMNQANSMLEMIGLEPIEQGITDFVAMRLQPENYFKYFKDEVLRKNPKMLSKVAKVSEKVVADITPTLDAEINRLSSLEKNAVEARANANGLAKIVQQSQDRSVVTDEVLSDWKRYAKEADDYAKGIEQQAADVRKSLEQKGAKLPDAPKLDATAAISSSDIRPIDVDTAAGSVNTTNDIDLIDLETVDQGSSSITTQPKPQVLANIDQSTISPEIKGNTYQMEDIAKGGDVLSTVYPDKKFGVFSTQGSSAVLYHDLDNPNILYKVAREGDDDGFTYFAKEAENIRKLSEEGFAPKLIEYKGKGSSPVPVIVEERVDILPNGFRTWDKAKRADQSSKFVAALRKLDLSPGDIEMAVDAKTGNLKLVDSGGFRSLTDEDGLALTGETLEEFTDSLIDGKVKSEVLIDLHPGQNPVAAAIKGRGELAKLGYTDAETDEAILWEYSLPHRTLRDSPKFSPPFNNDTSGNLLKLAERAANGASDADLEHLIFTRDFYASSKEEFRQAIAEGRKTGLELGLIKPDSPVLPNNKPLITKIEDDIQSVRDNISDALSGRTKTPAKPAELASVEKVLPGPAEPFTPEQAATVKQLIEKSGILDKKFSEVFYLGYSQSDLEKTWANKTLREIIEAGGQVFANQGNIVIKVPGDSFFRATSIHVRTGPVGNSRFVYNLSRDELNVYDELTSKQQIPISLKPNEVPKEANPIASVIHTVGDIAQGSVIAVEDAVAAVERAVVDTVDGIDSLVTGKPKISITEDASIKTPVKALSTSGKPVINANIQTSSDISSLTSDELTKRLASKQKLIETEQQKLKYIDSDLEQMKQKIKYLQGELKNAKSTLKPQILHDIQYYTNEVNNIEFTIKKNSQKVIKDTELEISKIQKALEEKAVKVPGAGVNVETPGDVVVQKPADNGQSPASALAAPDKPVVVQNPANVSSLNKPLEVKSSNVLSGKLNFEGVDGRPTYFTPHFNSASDYNVTLSSGKSYTISDNYFVNPGSTEASDRILIPIRREDGTVGMAYLSTSEGDYKWFVGITDKLTLKDVRVIDRWYVKPLSGKDAASLPFDLDARIKDLYGTGKLKEAASGDTVAMARSFGMNYGIGNDDLLNYAYFVMNQRLAEEGVGKAIAFDSTILKDLNKSPSRVVYNASQKRLDVYFSSSEADVRVNFFLTEADRAEISKNVGTTVYADFTLKPKNNPAGYYSGIPSLGRDTQNKIIASGGWSKMSQLFQDTDVGKAILEQIKNLPGNPSQSQIDNIVKLAKSFVFYPNDSAVREAFDKVVQSGVHTTSMRPVNKNDLSFNLIQEVYAADSQSQNNYFISSDDFEAKVKKQLIVDKYKSDGEISPEYIKGVLEKDIFSSAASFGKGYLMTTGKDGSIRSKVEQNLYKVSVDSFPGLDIRTPKYIDTRVEGQAIIPLAITKGSGQVIYTDYNLKPVKPTPGKDAQVIVLAYSDKNGNNRIDDGEQQLPWAGITVKLTKVYETRSINLNQGWNLISLNNLPEGKLTASSLLAEIARQGGYATTISTLSQGEWKSYVLRGSKSYSTDDFVLERGKGYFVKVINPVILNLEEKSDTGGIKISLEEGWNAVGSIPVNDKANLASDLLDRVNKNKIGADSLARFESGLWDAFVFLNKQKYGNNFLLEEDRGYILRVGGTGEFTP